MPTSMHFTPLYCFLILLGLCDALHAQDRVLRAGASLSNITPPLGTEIVGNFNRPIANYIHDELYAKTLVLDDGEQRLAIIILDNIGTAREVLDAAKAMIENKLEIPYSNILIAGTHTHSAISAQKQGDLRSGYHYGEPLDDYQLFVAKRIMDGVQTALGNLESARIGWGTVDAPEHVFNRRWIMKEPVWSPLGFQDKARMNPGIANPNLVEPAGPTDPEVSFIAVESTDGRPICLLANYSLHYVGGVPAGHISADYFGVFGDRIQELLGADRQHPPFVGIMSNGTSGDINNINWPGPTGPRHGPYEKMTIVAHDLAEKVVGAYQDITFQNWVELGARTTDLPLKVRRASPELLANIDKIVARPESDPPLFHNLEKTYAKRIMQMEEEWPDEIQVPLQTMKIGDLGISAIPFEVFAETGLEIKDKSPFAHTFTIELANGTYGYLPTPGQHKLGGYETWISTNKVEEQATVKIVDTLLMLFRELKVN